MYKQEMPEHAPESQAPGVNYFDRAQNLSYPALFLRPLRTCHAGRVMACVVDVNGASLVYWSTHCQDLSAAVPPSEQTACWAKLAEGLEGFLALEEYLIDVIARTVGQNRYSVLSPVPRCYALLC